MKDKILKIGEKSVQAGLVFACTLCVLCVLFLSIRRFLVAHPI